MSAVLVETRNLKRHFPVKAGLFGTGKLAVHAVDGISVAIREQETFALVGESGCGKTTLGRLLLRLEEKTSGSVLFRGMDIHTLDEGAMRDLRRRMQIIFQDPFASLNPRMRVRDILAEPLVTHHRMSTLDLDERIRELSHLVGLKEDDLRRYPHQFSGGQRQRIGIARALALHPEFIVCDEAVSALDVSIQAQILNLLNDLQEMFRLTYLFITHDLGVVRHIADRVCVMFLGKAVELGPTDEIFERPLHPYTKFLIEAVPVPDPRMRGRKREILTGELPSPVHIPSGCRFHTRCPCARAVCGEEDPAFVTQAERSFACHFPLQEGMCKT
ncbi:MAG: ABC transporter ATP-binding protein [bacterium]